MLHLNVRAIGLCVCIIPIAAVLLGFSGAPPVQQPGAVSQDRSGDSQATPKSGPEQPAPPGNALPLQFESHGLEYEALTKNGITVMFAPLPPHIKDFNVVQITVTNGSLVPWTVRPGDFSYVRQDGTVLPSISADDVVESLLERASRTDVVKLQLLYESSIYALSNYRPTNGYEQRREAAMAQFVNPRFKAAAAASAITFVAMKLKPGDSTDGAIFFENHTKEKALGSGRLVAHTCGENFLFEVYSEPKPRP
jgi:hypothetical protein